MKNKIYKILTATFVVTFLLLTSSCEDFTEFDRDFIIAEEGSINNTTDLQRLLLGAYDSNDSYQQIMDQNSIGSDETRIGLGNRGQGLQQHSFTLNTDSAIVTNMYFSAYDQIDNLNRVIRLIDNGTVTAFDAIDQDLLDQMEGEARALRAWQYFDLLRFYSPSFDTNAAGVPLVTEVLEINPENLILPRSSVGEILSFINDELIAASQLIPASLVDVSRFNRNAITALQARIALYVGTDTDLQNAITLSTELLNAQPISDESTFSKIFRDDDIATIDESELIFQIERDPEDTFNTQDVGNIWTATNNDVFFSMSTDLESVMSNSDIRYTINLDQETDITPAESSSDDLIVGKFLGSAGNNYINNIKVFRTGEMQLIRAEANARLGNLGDAQADIEELRTIRGSSQTTPMYTTELIAFEDILLERRIELAFEGHRLFDLKRFGVGINRPADDCSSDDRPDTTCSLEANSFRFTFPIPQDEIFANDGISDADQNPGY